MKKSKRIYYVPGIISLIGLPILCCTYLYFCNIKDERVLEVTIASKYEKKYENLSFDTTFLSRPSTKRKYIDIELNGNQKDNEVKTDFFRVLTREMYKNKDTIHGVHIIFGDGSKYGSFVKVLNNFRIDSIAVYCPFENHIWALYLKNAEVKYRERLIKRNAETAEEKTFADVAPQPSLSDVFNYIKHIWPIGIMYLLLLILTITRLRRSNNSHL